MKTKQNRKAILFVFLMVVYLILGFFAVNQMTHQMSEEYMRLLGTKALDLAKMASRQLVITDKDVADLKSLTYEEMMEHPLNMQLKTLFQDGDFSDEVKYAYLWTILDETEIKYRVTEEDAEYYDKSPGTPLNIVWLLDVTVNEAEAFAEDADGNFYANDQNRYSVATQNDYSLWSNPREVYLPDHNEYGKVIVGYFPIYTVENHFVGCMNIDIYYDAFDVYIKENRTRFSLLFILPTLILTLVYIAIYIRKSKTSSIALHTDPMTGLFNRRFLDVMLPRLVKDASIKKVELSSIMIDIDFFKNYNDHYGHKAGDEVIIKVAQAIKSVTRKEMDFVFRYGGEEIFLLLPNTNAQGAMFVAQKIKNVVEEQKIIHEYSAVCDFLTVSEGVFSNKPSATGDEICDSYIVNSDHALYQAKESGRNCIKLYSNHE